MSNPTKKVLVVGGGGREHAIVDALSRSPQVAKIYAAPGNAGIAGQAECVDIKDTEIERIANFVATEGIDLTVVGPEAALAKGIADLFQSRGLAIFAPSKAATQIESSKEFAKDLMKKYSIPTADYHVFDNFDEAKDFVDTHPLPTVIKYDGLAAGKGVVVATTADEAHEALRDMLLDDKFGHGRVVIEEYLTGPEFSFMCFVDGENVYPMQIAQDHKRAYDADCGPNTGGMGAYSPVPFISDADIDYAYNHIMCPVAKALVAENCSFSGVLYGGLMRTPAGVKVIEFNARFGDPETEVVLPRLESDIYAVFDAVAHHQPVHPLRWSSKAAVGVVLASKGYPDHYAKGFEIKGLHTISANVYHMGTTIADGKLVTNGGRVLFITAMGNNVAEARQLANAEVDKVQCDNLFHRTDIGWQAVK